MKRLSKIYIFSQHGFSLVEMMAAIVIISILLSIGTLGFNQWQNKTKAESQVREMAADISELRVRAMTNKQPASVTLNNGNYILKAYTSVFVRYSSDITVSQQRTLPGGTRTVKFPLTKTGGSTFSGQILEIDERGMVTPTQTIPSVPFSIFLGGTGSFGSIDCLTVGVVRVNVGKNSGGVCNDK